MPEDRDSGVRLTLRTSPRERLSGVPRFQYGDHERLGTATQLVSPPGPVPPAAGDSTLDDHSFAFTPRGPEGESHHETRAHIASAHFEFGAGSRRLVSETAWVDFDASTLDDIDFSASANVDFLRDETFRQFSQELRVATPRVRGSSTWRGCSISAAAGIRSRVASSFPRAHSRLWA